LALVAVGVSWLFLKTVRDTMSEPYVTEGAELSGWSLVVTEPAPSAIAVLALKPPPRLADGLFNQVFSRTMESLTAPGMASMPIVLQSEYLASLRTVFSLEEILEITRRSGLENSTLTPVCLGLKREPYGGRVRQFFFALFESPVFRQFREELAALYTERGGSAPFDPAALDPVLPIASSDSDFRRWWPLSINLDLDCQAPLT
jgi:hypothetical protein